MIIYHARHVVPVAAPPVPGGAVAVEGDRIRAVGPRAEVLAAAGSGAEERDLGDVVLLPGLVNAHTHLEFAWMREDPPPPGDYVEWLRGLMERREREPDEAERIAAAEKAVEEIAARGVVAVGEVTNSTWTADVVARSSLRGTIFLELYGFRGADAERILAEAAAALDRMAASLDTARARDRIGIALTPHAAHTTSAPLLKALAGRARASGEPLSIHVAESEAERSLLQDGTGPFVDFLKERNSWDDGWTPPGQPPLEYLDRLGVLSERTMVVHCVHLGHQDLSRLQSRRATVVACPRSNARLGVGRAPVVKLLHSGIPVALGTDSLAAVPDLDLFAEVAALHQAHPGLPPAAALRMATLNGARALGLDRDLGSLEPGKLALMVAVEMEDPAADPLETLVAGPSKVAPLGVAAGAD